MLRTAFQGELNDLHAAILELGGRVQRAVEESMLALRNADDEWSQQIIDGDEAINRTRWELEERAIALIGAQAPVASDLRRLVSHLSVLGDLERIGDHAAGIAKINQLLGAENPPRKLAFLPGMSDRALAMLADALRAYEQDDVEVARHVSIADDDLDRLQERVYHDAFQAMVRDPSRIERNTYLLWVAHNLERIGDRCTNICERVIYNVEGALYDLNPTRD
jgi:phosphate transport system protein